MAWNSLPGNVVLIESVDVSHCLLRQIRLWGSQYETTILDSVVEKEHKEHVHTARDQSHGYLGPIFLQDYFKNVEGLGCPE